ncbi:MAG: prephenate dehydrogenase/arogenate dehydrogenase family protein [Candidatus Omnitrophica bacterium]|nr:prephenate dehydrogenase/arogenate dehydrogenase family protein [Candidatus Omnitrophota bacterium]
MSPRTIAIVGLGLIGGSLGLAFKKKFPRARVLGLSRSSAKIARAKKIKAIDGGSTDARRVLSRADLVMICTPVSKIPFWIRETERWARPGCLVTDVGSTKREIVSRAEKSGLRKIRFVGSHPMAGSHQTGLEAARKDLFRGSVCFVTRTKRSDPSAVRSVAAVWRKLAGRVVVLDPSRHDRVAAQISHLPHALAALLVVNTPLAALPFAAAGFRDSTRIAQGDPRLWKDIFLTNRAFLLRGLRKQVVSMERLMKLLKASDSASLERLLARAATIRRKMKTPA